MLVSMMFKKLHCHRDSSRPIKTQCERISRSSGLKILNCSVKTASHMTICKWECHTKSIIFILKHGKKVVGKFMKLTIQQWNSHNRIDAPFFCCWTNEKKTVIVSLDDIFPFHFLSLAPCHHSHFTSRIIKFYFEHRFPPPCGWGGWMEEKK